MVARTVAVEMFKEQLKIPDYGTHSGLTSTENKKYAFVRTHTHTHTYTHTHTHTRTHTHKHTHTH